MRGCARPRVRIVDRDAALVESLSAVLRDAGYAVVRRCEPEPEALDALVIGVPPPPEVRPPLAPGVPALVLALPSTTWGELEAWVEGRARWALCSKPVPEEALLGSLRELVPPPAPETAREEPAREPAARPRALEEPARVALAAGGDRQAR